MSSCTGSVQLGPAVCSDHNCIKIDGCLNTAGSFLFFIFFMIFLLTYSTRQRVNEIASKLILANTRDVILKSSKRSTGYNGLL